jgi:mannose-6-phosphate isomerase-like protein (cupin superfamily)
VGYETQQHLVEQNRRTTMPQVHRVVIGVNDEKQSAVIYRDSPNQQEVPEIFWQSTLWATTELPVNNQIKGDRGADVAIREPEENGLIFRAVEFPPNIQDTKKLTEILQEVNKEVKQKYPPTEKDLARDPGMHRTDTCDMFVVAYGEIYLVTDRDEALLKPGDTAVVQGVNHAWSNRSDKPCMIIGVNMHATPWPKDQYPAEGL